VQEGGDNRTLEFPVRKVSMSGLDVASEAKLLFEDAGPGLSLAFRLARSRNPGEVAQRRSERGLAWRGKQHRDAGHRRGIPCVRLLQRHGKGPQHAARALKQRQPARPLGVEDVHQGWVERERLQERLLFLRPLGRGLGEVGFEPNERPHRRYGVRPERFLVLHRVRVEQAAAQHLGYVVTAYRQKRLVFGPLQDSGHAGEQLPPPPIILLGVGCQQRNHQRAGRDLCHRLGQRLQKVLELGEEVVAGLWVLRPIRHPHHHFVHQQQDAEAFLRRHLQQLF